MSLCTDAGANALLRDDGDAWFVSRLHLDLLPGQKRWRSYLSPASRGEQVEKPSSGWTHAFLSLFIPAILPPPLQFKVFVLAEGVFQVPLRTFVLALVWGRAAIFRGGDSGGALWRRDAYFYEDAWSGVRSGDHCAGSGASRAATHFRVPRFFREIVIVDSWRSEDRRYKTSEKSQRSDELAWRSFWLVTFASGSNSTIATMLSQLESSSGKRRSRMETR